MIKKIENKKKEKNKPRRGKFDLVAFLPLVIKFIRVFQHLVP